MIDLDLDIIRRAIAKHGHAKLAFEVERLEGGAAPTGADATTSACVAVGTRYAKHAAEARAVADGIAALQRLEE